MGEFLTQRDKIKMKIKITGMIIMNLEIFDQNFIFFGQVKLLK
jgi:hypothetical protein